MGGGRKRAGWAGRLMGQVGLKGFCFIDMRAAKIYLQKLSTVFLVPAENRHFKPVQ
jgi:hypothetical protein